MSDAERLAMIRHDVAEYIDDVTCNEDVAAILRLYDAQAERLREIEALLDRYKDHLAPCLAREWAG